MTINEEVSKLNRRNVKEKPRGMKSFDGEFEYEQKRLGCGCGCRRAAAAAVGNTDEE